MPIDLLDELSWRGLLHQCTDEPALREHLGDPAHAPRKVYAGFDPTSDSLTIGNLVPIMVLVHVARSGHTPVVVMGGGTGLIGDPSGKSAERQLMTEETVRSYVDAQRPIYAHVFEGAGDTEGRELPTPMILNNLDWLSNLGFLRVLRDVGKHFSVNMMMQKDSVRDRLHEREQGISYTEFSYMILQSYDFLHLFRERGVTIQMGGSDQWGNIVAGVDLIRRVTTPATPTTSPASLSRGTVASLGSSEPSDALTPHAFGLTAPLITKADGGKFGKTESGAIWLTPERTSPYAYHQFWLNASDADVVRFLRFFTLLPRDEIERLATEVETSPGVREAQKALAHHATALLYGEEESKSCELAGRALFTGEIADLGESTLRAVLGEVPSSAHPRAALEAGVPIVDLLVETALASSKRQAREFIASGSISMNGRRVSETITLGPSDLLHGELIALRRGKKTWHVTGGA